MHLSFLPIIHPSGLSVGGVFPHRVILPAWPVWLVELVDAATGLAAADSLARHGSTEPAQLTAAAETQRLLSCPSRGVRADTLAEPCKQNLLITDLARSGQTHTHTHTLPSINLEDKAVEWFDKGILLHK